MPQDRQALGLGLVIAAGLLYVSAGFAIQVITKSGESAFLVSYISTCLFVLHFPCVALVRWCRTTSFGRTLRGERTYCRFDWEFPEYPPKDKLSDGGGSPETGSSHHWEKLTTAETENSKAGGGALEGSAQGPKLEWAAVSDVGCDDGEQPSSDSESSKAALLLGSEDSSADPSNRGASEPQTPSLSVLDAWKADPVSGKLVGLTPGQVATRDENQAVNMGMTEEEKLKIVDLMLEAQHRSQVKRDLIPNLSVNAYARLGGANTLGPFTVGPFTVGPFTLCAEHLEAVKIAAAVAPLWFLAQYTYTLSLTLTTVTSNTILFSCTSLFTFLVSVIWLKEPFTFVKLGMIACAIVGTAVVSVSDAKSAAESDGPAHSASGAALGNALVLVAALVYAFYGTCMKYMNPEGVEGEDGSLSPFSKPVSSPVSTSLVFGYMGLLGGLFLLPWLVLLHWIGVESLQWMGARTFGLLVVKALFGNVVADYLCARAMLLTSPTAASVGLAFQTPVAIVADLVIFGIVPKPLMLVGGVLVMWGFLGMNLFDQGQSDKAPISEV